MGARGRRRRAPHPAPAAHLLGHPSAAIALHQSRCVVYSLHRSVPNNLPPSCTGAAARGSPGTPATDRARGLLLLSIFCEFWLTDGDEPLPAGVAGAGAAAADRTVQLTSLRLAMMQLDDPVTTTSPPGRWGTSRPVRSTSTRCWCWCATSPRPPGAPGRRSQHSASRPGCPRRPSSLRWRPLGGRPHPPDSAPPGSPPTSTWRSGCTGCCGVGVACGRRRMRR